MLFRSRELSEHVALALKNRKATLLQHHGLIACEVNLEKGYHTLLHLQT